MFGFFRKRKVRDAEALLDASLNRITFVSRVEELRQKAGYSEKLPLENLVLDYAMNLADTVFRSAKSGGDAAEKAAMLVVFAQSVHMSSRMVGIGDKELKSVMMQNGMAALLQTDLDSPSPQAQAEMALGVTAYEALSAQRLALLRKIDELSNSYLLTEREESFRGLVDCWRQVVAFLRGSEGTPKYA